MGNGKSQKEIKMKEYIVNLTNNLIGKHGFDLIFESMKATNPSGHTQQFFKLVHMTIGSNDVRDMSPETLGKVICSIDGDEIPIMYPAEYAGNPDGYLRSAVSKFLAWSILYRFDSVALKRHTRIPAYFLLAGKANTKTVSPEFRGLVDKLVEERQKQS